jgi:hypothetical protein
MDKMTQQLTALAWIEEVLASTDAKSKIEAAVTANATMTNSIVKQLTALRAQLRENAYSKIYEARAAVGDDLLKLTQSLTTLIHFSSVAGEDTSAYVALLRSVSKVTQQLSFFGEEDADGDGIRDDAENTNPELDLQIDDGNPPPSDDAVVAPKDEVQDPSETESPDVDPDSVQPDDAGGEAQPEDQGEVSDEGAGEQGEGEEPAPEDGQEGEIDEDGEIQQDGGENTQDAENDFDNVVQNLRRGKKPAKKEDGEEEGDEDGKKSFLEKIDDEDAGTAESSVSTAGAHEFRFAYLGVDARGESVVAVVGDKRYFYTPTEAVFGGDVTRLDKAIRKLMAQSAGYSAVLQKINGLVRAKKLTISHVDLLTSAKEVRDNVSTEIDRAQLGATDIPAGTPWRYRGIGIQKVSNQEICMWFEIGSKEYAAIPNPKALKKDEDIEGFSERVQGRLKTLSYDDGLTFLVGLVKRKVIKVIFAGKIQ